MSWWKKRESKSIRVGFETQAHKPWPHCVFSPYITAFGSPCARHPRCLPPGLLAILVSSLILLLDVSEVVRAPFATIKPWLRHRLMVAPDHQNWAEKGQKSRQKVNDGETMIYGYLWWCQLMLFPKYRQMRFSFFSPENYRISSYFILFPKLQTIDWWDFIIQYNSPSVWNSSQIDCNRDFKWLLYLWVAARDEASIFPSPVSGAKSFTQASARAIRWDPLWASGRSSESGRRFQHLCIFVGKCQSSAQTRKMQTHATDLPTS